MSRQIIFLGTTANDGTGDTMRTGGAKINLNFAELYKKFGGDSINIPSTISITNKGLQYTSDSTGFASNFNFTIPTANRTITLPDESITIVGTASVQTLTNKTLTTPTLTTPKITGGSFTYNITGGSLAANRTIYLPVAVDSDTIVFTKTSQTLTNKNLTTPIMTTPRIKTSIQDSNGADVIIIGSTPSAVNQITINNAIAAASPSIVATGSTANLDLKLIPKGTGGVVASNVKFTGSVVSGDSANAMLSWNGKMIYAAETVTSGTAAISLNTWLTIFNSATALASLTLAAGQIGQSKKFVNIGAGLATITPTAGAFAHGTKFNIAQKGSIEAIFAGTQWHLVGHDSDNKITITP